MVTLGIIGGLGMPEIILIAFVLLLFFGARKIPELMRGLGKGVKSFKEGVKGIDDEIKEAVKETETDEGAGK
ncbi:MAG: twin-arginine translocase TatA/TatE family subunit [Bacteroidales bacterium]|jgi:sec-independent protein translocase protein TatA|nr:twin-arginine translocase TatA/TatE family subunit [Bacteroidales bacterium]